MPRLNPRAEGWRESVKTWIESHPNWGETHSIQHVFKLITSENSKKNYSYYLPHFFKFVDMGPDQIIELRKAHIQESPPDRFFEDRITEFKNMFVELGYSKATTNGYLGVFAGFFSNFHPSYQLNLSKSFWKLEESKERTAKRKRKQPPTNAEIKAIYSVMDRKARISLLLGYQSGLAPVDTVKLTWTNLNVDFDNNALEFIPIDHNRSKTGEEGTIILNPDIIHILKAEWTDQGKPKTGHILNYRGEPLQSRHPNEWLRDAAIKALGKERGTALRFKDLRDAHNNVIKNTPGIKQQFADRLMGHTIGAKGAYYVGDAELNAYKEIFKALTINGWRYKEASENVGKLENEIKDTKAIVIKLQDDLEQWKAAYQGVDSHNDQLMNRVSELESTVKGLAEYIKVLREGSA